MDLVCTMQGMLPPLTGLTMTVWEGDDGPLVRFEHRFCLLPQVQTLYTVAGLHRFFAKRGEEAIYRLRGPLGTCLVALKLEARWVLLGPYVTTAWQEGEARALLAGLGAQESTLPAYKTYRCALPVLAATYVVRVAALLLANTVGGAPREVRTIERPAPPALPALPGVPDGYAAPAQVERRYALENQFIEAVTHGRTALAQRAYAALRQLAQSMPSNFQEELAQAMAMHTLVRRAALAAGLEPVLVETLHREYVQKLARVSDARRLPGLCKECITAFCRIVRANAKPGYSPSVQQAVQYIELHLSQPMDADRLAAACGAKRRAFATLFRQETGLAVNQYIARARCLRAAELLTTTRLTVQEVGHYVGYADTNYFARVFKRVTGQAPQLYRKQKSS